MIHVSDIHVRDPFIVPVVEEQKYYLYNAAHPEDYTKPGIGFDAYSSIDLIHWDGPFPVFRPEPGFWSNRDFWAPEVHRYRNRFYLMASFKAEGVCRARRF